MLQVTMFPLQGAGGIPLKRIRRNFEMADREVVYFNLLTTCKED